MDSIDYSVFLNKSKDTFVKQSINLGVRNINRSIKADLTPKLRKEFEKWDREVHRNITRKKGLEKVHEKVAQRATNAIVSRYDQTKKPSHPYRGADTNKNRTGTNKRYTGGVLRSALKSPELIRYDNDGIYFVNIKHLDRSAKQWARLNFGTVGGSDHRPNHKPMTFFGIKTDISMSISNIGQSKSFTIPYGYWSATHRQDGPRTSEGLAGPKGSRDAFYPMRYGGNQRRQAVAIDRRNFLSAGSSYINRYYPYYFEKTARGWLEKK